MPSPFRVPNQELISREDRVTPPWHRFFDRVVKTIVAYTGNTNANGVYANTNEILYADANGVPKTLSNVTATAVTNFTPINQDGIVSAETGWDDLRFEAASVGSVKNTPALGIVNLNGANLVTRAFTDEAVAGNEKEVVFVAQMPHGYARDRGATSNIRLHIHWAAANTLAAANAVFGLEATWSNISGTWPASTFYYANARVTAGSATNLHRLTTIAELDGAGKTESSVLCCRLFRNSSNASDDYANVVHLVTADFHIQREKFGSRNEIPGV